MTDVWGISRGVAQLSIPYELITDTSELVPVMTMYILTTPTPLPYYTTHLQPPP